MRSLAFIIELSILSAFAQTAGGNEVVLSDETLYPIEYAKAAKLGEDVSFTVRGSGVLKKVFELIEKRRVNDGGPIVSLSLAWCSFSLKEPRELSLNGDATLYELLTEVATALDSQFVESNWGFILVPKDYDVATAVNALDGQKNDGHADLSRYWCRGGNPIFLSDIDPSHSGVSEFLHEVFSIHSQLLDGKEAPKFSWSDNSAKPENLVGTETSSYFGMWTYLSLVQAICILHNKTWDYDQLQDAIRVVPGAISEKEISNPSRVPNSNTGNIEDPFQ